MARADGGGEDGGRRASEGRAPVQPRICTTVSSPPVLIRAVLASDVCCIVGPCDDGPAGGLTLWPAVGPVRSGRCVEFSVV